MEADPLLNHLVLESFGFIISLFGCALFAFLETSITAIRLFKLKELASTTQRYQGLLKTLEQNPQQVLITILIANNIVNVSAAALITTILEVLLAKIQLTGGLAFSLSIGIATIIILIFGEVLPKNIAKVHGERWFRSTLWITNIIYYLLYPFVTVLIKLSNLVTNMVGGSAETEDAVSSEREIRFLIDYIYEKGLLETEKTEMLRGIFQLGHKEVKEIMVPAVNIIMLSTSTSIQKALDTFAKYQYSRLPVYEDSPENVIGMMYQKDMFTMITKKEEKPLENLIRPIMFVPESMHINQLLRQFRQQGMHIAMVLNEFGSITGLVTLEDVLEEIVGEISDEYEETPRKIVPFSNENYLVDASLDLEELGTFLGITFTAKGAVTLGGFLAEQLQHVPKIGEHLVYHGYHFEIHNASHKRVSHVLVYKEPEKK